jgi:regulator of protease activity HflC (stomatin/prohibitin superfamily)
MAKYSELLEKTPPPKKRGWLRFIGRHLPGLSIGLMVVLLTITVLWPYVVITVPSGMVGVLWRRFYAFDFYCLCFVGRGTALDPRELREEGLHIIWPWDHLFLYNLRLQSTTQTYNAISKDGVSVSAQINVRFQLQHNSVAVLHKFIGPAYLTSVVAPEIGSQAREVISQYTAQEVYTSREAIQERIRENAQKRLGANLNKLVQPEAMEELDPKHYNDFLQGSIQILDTLVLSIELPPDIVAAINRQTEQFYMIQEYRFRVAREAEESKRKQIEANGIAAFQQTVSKGISDSYLRWRGIEATLALAQSSNSKIVVIGSGKDGLPIILGNVDTPSAAGAAPGPTPAPPGAPPPQSDKTSSSQTPPAASEKAPASESAPPPAEKTPPGSSPSPPPATAPPAGTPSGAAPQGAAPPGKSSNNAPPASDKPSNVASSAAPPSSEQTPSAPTAVSLGNLETILSKISGVLRPTGSAPGATTASQQK